MTLPMKYEQTHDGKIIVKGLENYILLRKKHVWKEVRRTLDEHPRISIDNRTGNGAIQIGWFIEEVRRMDDGFEMRDRYEMYSYVILYDVPDYIHTMAKSMEPLQNDIMSFVKQELLKGKIYGTSAKGEK